MAGFNKIIQMGNLTRDPETKQVGDGSVTEFGLAINTSYYSKAAGERKEDVCFIDVAFWGARGEAVAKHLRKGDPILVEGRIAFRTWEDRETGAKRSKHSLVGDNFTFVGSKRDDGRGRSGGNAEGSEGFDEVPF